jgi:hypothetical protein
VRSFAVMTTNEPKQSSHYRLGLTRRREPQSHLV